MLNCLLDGRQENSNNRAERSIKPFVIDRKNCLFANRPGGAQGSAVIFSMIQKAIENGLDPWRYLTWLIDTAAKRAVAAEGLFLWGGSGFFQGFHLISFGRRGGHPAGRAYWGVI